MMALIWQNCSKTYIVENGLFLTLGSGTFSARNKNLRPPLNTNTSLISGKYGLRNHFWPLESDFSHEQKWVKARKRGWSYQTPPTPFYRSTRSQNSCQIEFSSKNDREISSSIFGRTNCSNCTHWRSLKVDSDQSNRWLKRFCGWDWLS